MRPAVRDGPAEAINIQNLPRGSTTYLRVSDSRLFQNPSDYSAVASYTRGALPAAHDLMASADGTWVTLNWQCDALGPNSGFIIERSRDGQNFQYVAGVSGTEHTYSHNVAAGHYVYRVTATESSRQHQGPGYGVGGSSYGYSTPVTAAVDAGSNPPIPPTDLNAKAIAQDTIELLWADHARDEDNFEVQQSTDGVNFTSAAQTGKNVNHVQVGGLEGGVNYTFRVRAVNENSPTASQEPPTAWAQAGASIALPQVSIAANLEAHEHATDPGQWWVARSGDVSQDLQVQYQVIAGDFPATQGEDYVALAGSVTIPRGFSSVPIVLEVVDDQTPEWTEDVKLNLTDAADYDLPSDPTQQSAAVEIVDNDLKISELPDVLVINNDDDNANGISDLEESGSVGGEDDLYEVQLDFPHRTKEGATVTLSASNGKIHVWENADRSGEKYVDETHSSRTWTIGQETPPQRVYVEAVAGSSSVDDVVLALADSDAGATSAPHRPTMLPNSPATTRAATTHSTAEGIQLSLDNNPIPNGGNNGEVIVGQRINLSATWLGPNTGELTYEWQLPDKNIAYWQVVGTSIAKIPTSTNKKDTSFVWYNGGEKEVKIKITSPSRPPRDATTHFNVKRPTAQITSSSRQVTLDNNYFQNLHLLAMHLGDGNKDNPDTVGMFLKAGDAGFVGFPGELQWIQTVDFSRSEHRVTDMAWYDSNASGLDGVYPYDTGPKTGDSPGVFLHEAQADEQQVDHHFKTYLMYRPNT